MDKKCPLSVTFCHFLSLLSLFSKAQGIFKVTSDRHDIYCPPTVTLSLIFLQIRGSGDDDLRNETVDTSVCVCDAKRSKVNLLGTSMILCILQIWGLEFKVDLKTLFPTEALQNYDCISGNVFK